jgi:uncharacterized phage protein (TIGR02220 family)
MNSYELSRDFVDFSFENPSKIKPNHYALYFFAIEHCNRLGWKKEFGLPTTMTMEAIGIKSYNTYINTFNELVEFGFFSLIEKSKNQYSSNIIALSNFNKALDKALDKAFIKHATKQSESTQQSTSESIDSINKPINNKPIKQKTNKPINNILSSETKVSCGIDFDKLLEFFNQTTNKKCRVIPKKVKNQFNARLKDGYTKKDFSNAIVNCFNDPYHRENPKFLTLEFISRPDKLDKYLNYQKSKSNITTTADDNR